jgi:hypothetical protein
LAIRNGSCAIAAAVILVKSNVAVNKAIDEQSRGRETNIDFLRSLGFSC